MQATYCFAHFSKGKQSVSLIQMMTQAITQLSDAIEALVSMMDNALMQHPVLMLKSTSYCAFTAFIDQLSTTCAPIACSV